MTSTTDNEIASAVANGLNCVVRDTKGGSTARVFIVERSLQIADAGAFTRCIKVFRHELADDAQHKSLLRRFTREADVLLKISHSNVVKLFGADFITYTIRKKDYTVPFLETEAVVAPQDLDQYLMSLADPRQQATTFMRFLNDCADALRHFHEHALYHMDIKPANIVVGSDGVPRITDFGFARMITTTTSDLSGSIYTTQKWFPDYYITQRRLLTPVRTKGKVNPNRTPYRLAHGVPENAVYNHGTDLHMFVATARHVLQNALTERARTYVDEALLRNVFDTFTIDDARPRGEDLPRADAFIRAIEGVSHVDTSPTRTPELRGSSFVRTMRVAPDLHVGITRATDAILETPGFQRLRRTIQLGFCDYVYPSAKHTRFEHSLGTYHWAREYVNALLQNRGSVTFRELFTSSDIQTLLLAALLHDIGQHAVAHNFEEEDADQTFKHLGLTIAIGHPAASTYFKLPSLPSRFARPLVETAKRAGATINDELFLYLATLDLDAPARQDKWLAARHSDHPEWDLLADVVSGPLDVDKLDYLQRDSYSCGLTYHQLLDTRRLLQSLTVVETARPAAPPPRGTKPWFPQRQAAFALGTDYKGVIIVETFFFLRKLMLSQVYWHKTVRGVHSLIALAYRHAKAECGPDWPEHLRGMFFLDRDSTVRYLADILRKSRRELRKRVGAAVAALRERDHRLPQLGLELTPPDDFVHLLERVQTLKARGRDTRGERWLQYQQEVFALVARKAKLTDRDGFVWVDVPNHPVAGTRNSAERLNYKRKDGTLKAVKTATLAAIEGDALVKETPTYRVYCSTKHGAEKIRAVSDAIIQSLRNTGL